MVNFRLSQVVNFQLSFRNALPDLENAPLFQVMGKSKDYGDASGKIYRFDESVKDAWANLFEYKGSLENVRLRFSVEKLGIKIENVVILCGDQSDTHETGGWDRFLEKIRKPVDDKQTTRLDHDRNLNIHGFMAKSQETQGLKTEVNPLDPTGIRATMGNRVPVESSTSDSFAPFLSGDGITASATFPFDEKTPIKRRKQIALMAISCLFLLAAAVTLWKDYLRPASPTDSMKSGTPVSHEASFEASIAVLPFSNISGNSKEDYLSDGITEQIITSLSKTPKMLVIARNSVFTYKGKPVTVQQVGEELGVRYVLEGSVRKSGDRLRIAAQLIDAKTGNHLWSERYDRELKDLFEIQDEITMKVIEVGLK